MKSRGILFRMAGRDRRNLGEAGVPPAFRSHTRMSSYFIATANHTTIVIRCPEQSYENVSIRKTSKSMPQTFVPSVQFVLSLRAVVAVLTRNQFQAFPLGYLL